MIPHHPTDQISLLSHPEELPLARQFVADHAAAAGFDEDRREQIRLAVDEALANVIKHGYGGREDQPIELRAGAFVDEKGVRGLVVSVRDFGCQIDPSAIKSRDLDDVRPGGLGVHIMRAVMDAVVYSQADGGGMKVEMVKMNVS
jgi:anti-sigma regulatory factor (Ser/Thr protein kinase)